MFAIIAKVLLMAGLIGALIIGKAYLNMKDDHIVEELAEEIIENEVGLDVDLSPTTKEKELVQKL